MILLFDKDTVQKMLFLQKGEITDYIIYKKLARNQKSDHNKEILNNIAEDELNHYHFWEQYTKTKVKPNRFKVFFFFFIARIFGLTFGIKLMERGEVETQEVYNELKDKISGIQQLIDDEEEHEKELIDALDEEKLKYVGSIVLGLNDALVELTGTLAGLSFAFANPRYVALAGLITGIAASLSMASSEYLSTKQESSHGFALKSALYTGVAYVFAVAFMILPYLLLTNVYASLLSTIVIVILIIFVFNYYISVAKDFSFKKRFFEMVSISLGVALLSFGIGILVKSFLGIDIG
ncbi:VIT1/CCC1 transporter family protein [Mycoplasmatota bacterium]|nr:VIT1/CCC1 transporter family protein [Mycoplasmatota bacterium]